MSDWFGKSWGAPVCDPAKQIDVPVGVLCTECDKPITATDQGLAIPYAAMTGPPVPPTKLMWHLDCFLSTLGIPAGGQVIGSTSIIPSDDDCPACGHLTHDDPCPEQVRMGGDLHPCGCGDA